MVPKRQAQARSPLCDYRIAFANPHAPLSLLSHTPLKLRASFRQLLLLAFVLIAALLGAVSLSGLQALQGLLSKSRMAAEQSVQLNLATQALTERNTDMERAARQFIVLGDTALSQRFEDAATQAQRVLLPLKDYKATEGMAQHWQAGVERIRTLMADAHLPPGPRSQSVADEFRDLDGLARGMSSVVQQNIAQHNREIQDGLEAQRKLQVQQVLVAIALAAIAALLFGLWLTRPLKDLRDAITGLGQGLLKRNIRIRGPADLASLGHQLDWLRLRLTELEEDKARFLRHTSHELKTPLAALREGVALLQEGVGGSLGPQQTEIVGILQHNTGVLQQQIEDLLRFNAAAFDARNLKRTPSVLRAVIDDVVYAQRLSWQARGLTLKIEGDAELSYALDTERMGMALGNLLSNAIRFSPQGGVIRWWIGRVGSDAVVKIADEGPGIPAAEHDQVFEPFFRGANQPAAVPRGSGIGLAIVREQVAAHGGRVQLQSEPGGACFVIFLPLGFSHV